MKLTVLSSEHTWCTEDLARAAKEKGVEIAHYGYERLPLPEEKKPLGDVVLVRFMRIHKIFERPFLFTEEERAGTHIINEILFRDPMILYKSVQQHRIQKMQDREVIGIPTYSGTKREHIWELIEKGVLTLPCIEKPDLSAQGVGVRLIRTREDIEETKGKIYQNYIKNTGDYRVLCLGGIMLGAIRRIAKEGEYRNNISQGAHMEKVTEEKMLQKLSSIALKVSACFELGFSGIDIIYDETTEEYKVLEVNTCPGWEGFQKVMECNVADEIIQYAEHLHTRKQKTPQETITAYYNAYDAYLGPRNFHYHARYYLWTGEHFHKEKVATCKDTLFPEDPQERKIRMRSYLEGTGETYVDRMEETLRAPYIQQYKKMNALSHVFYKALFYHTLYGEDLREEIRMLVDKEECLMFKKQIEGDKNALAILSTIAVTYLYYLEYLFPEEGKVHPEVLLACAKEAYVGALKEKYLLQGYLLTHAIIGASYFYAKPIREHRSIYEEMWKETELLLIAHYGQLSLDLKCEFLVCTRMLEKETPLWKLIQEEAKRSYSPMGNFLVDKENTYKENYKKASLRTAEHRNVLYTMAFGTTPIFLEQPWL